MYLQRFSCDSEAIVSELLEKYIHMPIHTQTSQTLTYSIYIYIYTHTSMEAEKRLLTGTNTKKKVLLESALKKNPQDLAQCSCRLYLLCGMVDEDNSRIVSISRQNKIQ